MMNGAAPVQWEVTGCKTWTQLPAVPLMLPSLPPRCHRMVVLLVLHIEPAMLVPQQDEVSTEHREKQPCEVWFWHVVAFHGTTVGHCSNKRVTQL